MNGCTSDWKPFGRGLQHLCGGRGEVQGTAGHPFPWEKHSSSVFQLLSGPIDLGWTDGTAVLPDILHMEQLLMDQHSSSKDAGFSCKTLGDMLLVVLPPGRAAGSNEPLVLWIWVWVERASGFIASLLTRERIFRRTEPVFPQIPLPCMNHHLIPAKIGRLVHRRAK